MKILVAHSPFHQPDPALSISTQETDNALMIPLGLVYIKRGKGDGERATDESAKRPTERYQFHYNAKKVAFISAAVRYGVVAAAAGRRRSDFPLSRREIFLLFYVAAGRRETFSCRPLFLMCTIIRAVLLLMPRARLFRFRRSFVDGVTMPYKYRAGDDGDTIFVRLC
ncbi:hypothetical protein EVAR_98126_1 [Eumeta japonica]|uniref:Uncharacterized protein n=1 Tax=Eumeta variegata TaxID=151549 RepID=A0A4C2A7S6_EUMVA|nr:hypothetical protein EVAR_98126_1 [Eumeta japonica]